MPIVPEHKIDHARKLATSTSMALSEIAAVVGVSESTLRRHGLAAAASPTPPDAAVSLAPLQPYDSLNERLEEVARSVRAGAGPARCTAHAQSVWIWQLNSIAHQLTESVPRTRRDDTTSLSVGGRVSCCSPHTQG